MDYATNNLQSYYDGKYDRPSSDSEAISTIIKVYQTEMNDYSEKIGEGIGEIYRELLGKGLPSYYWFLEAIHRTAKKREEKRSFRYIVGTLRNWALYGFGNTLTDEEEEIFDFFKEVTRTELTASSRKILSSLMGNFGALKLMRSISDLKEIDLSIVFAEMLKKNMIDKYYVSIIDSTQKQTVNSELSDNKSKGLIPKPKGNRDISDNLKLMISYVEDFLRTNGVSRPTQIAQFLQEQGFENITSKNMTSYLVSIIKYSDKVKKVNIGQYAYQDS